MSARTRLAEYEARNQRPLIFEWRGRTLNPVLSIRLFQTSSDPRIPV